MTPERTLSPSAAWFVAIAATLAMSVSYIDRQVLAAVGESVRIGLDANHEQFGWLVSAFSLAYLFGAPLAGVVVDRIGARRGLLLAFLVWTAVAASHALATSFAVLFALRIALGIAEAPSFPSAAQAVRRALPPSSRSAGFGLLFTGSSVGAMIAAPLAVALDARFNWRIAFLVSALVGMAWIPLWAIATGSARAKAMLDARDVERPSERAGFASWWSLFSSRPVLRAVVLVIASAPAISFVLQWYPQYLKATFGIPKPELGRYLWIPPLAFDVGAVAFGGWASRRDSRAIRRGEATSLRSHRDLVAIGALLSATLAFAPLAKTPWTAVAIGSMSMIGGGVLYARLTAEMVTRVGVTRVAAAGGITAAAQSVAYVIAHPIIGRVVDRTHSYSGVMIVLGLVALPGSLAWILWPSREPIPLTA